MSDTTITFYPLTAATYLFQVGWKGEWNSSTQYRRGDVVVHQGSAYVALNDNEGSAPPSANWDLLASKGDQGNQGPQGVSFTWRGPWSSGTDYVVNDVVSHNGSTYIAIAPSTGQAPPNATYWNLMAAAASSEAHNLLSLGHSDTVEGSPSAGSLVVGNNGSPSKWEAFAKGTTGYFLRAAATALEWVQLAFSHISGTLSVSQMPTTSRYRLFLIPVPGNPSTGSTVSLRIINKFGSCTIVAVESTVRAAPSTGTYTYDLNKNGTTLYTTQSNRPTRVSADGTGRKAHTLPDIVSLSDNDVLDVDLDGAGSGIADFTLHVLVRLD